MVKYILVLLLSINFSFARELKCQDVINISQFLSPHHIYSPVVDQSHMLKTAESLLYLMDRENLFLWENEKQELLDQVKNNKEKIYNQVLNNDCSQFSHIIKTIKEKRIRYIKTILEELNVQKFSKVYYKRKFPYENFKDKEAMLNHIRKNFANFLLKKEALVNLYEERLNQAKKNDLTDIEISLKASLHAFDPHTDFFNKKESEDLFLSLSGSFKGFGFTSEAADFNTGLGMRILSVEENSPASKVLKKDDIIVQINDTNVKDLHFTAILELISDDKYNQENSQNYVFTVLRDKEIKKLAKIQKDVVDQKTSRIQKEVLSMKGKKIGIIKIPSFYHNEERRISCAIDFLNAYRELYQKEKIKLLIIDLRNNLGGSLQEAVQIAGLFIPKEVIVKVQNKEEIHDYTSPYDEKIVISPTVVLINKYSASASEIVSGALKDHGNALIVGDEHSFGKGSVQSLYDKFLGLGAVKTTIQLFFSPSGTPIQHRGIHSDIILPSVTNLKNIGEKYHKFSLSPKSLSVDFKEKTFLNEEQIKKLSEKSMKRIHKDKNFTKFNSKELLYNYYLENNQEKQKIEQIDYKLNAKEDIYLQESINIGLDMIEL